MSEQDRVKRLKAQLKAANRDRTGQTEASLLGDLRAQYGVFFAGLQELATVVGGIAPSILIESGPISADLIQDRILFGVVAVDGGSPFLSVEVVISPAGIDLGVKGSQNRAAVNLGSHSASEQQRALDVLYQHVGDRAAERLQTGR